MAYTSNIGAELWFCQNFTKSPIRTVKAFRAEKKPALLIAGLCVVSLLVSMSDVINAVVTGSWNFVVKQIGGSSSAQVAFFEQQAQQQQQQHEDRSTCVARLMDEQLTTTSWKDHVEQQQQQELETTTTSACASSQCNNNETACCSICLSSYECDDKVTTTAQNIINGDSTSCQHVFHRDCLHEW
eukprot:CAMPEP_0119547488 /NCGR_PEP_ID=MMETSP1352-20130426/1604_1 /TAXON_ID=265584 /ORGANISM="Stauroneis constricta, Strain CCMP1120" /LENGTH=184 /DNA_ID=CAMNT_0007592431 /DNA_START=249 /DNA_END=800 /DNA_ORIENTATION=+